MIYDARKILGRRAADLVVSELTRRGKPIPLETATEPVALAYINHSRWVIDCPMCNGAELADLDDPRFWCLSCDNRAAGGKYLPVEFPGNRAAIEKALMERERAETRNWRPGETVRELRSEMRSKGGA